MPIRLPGEPRAHITMGNPLVSTLQGPEAHICTLTGTYGTSPTILITL